VVCGLIVGPSNFKYHVDRGSRTFIELALANEPNYHQLKFHNKSWDAQIIEGHLKWILSFLLSDHTCILQCVDKWTYSVVYILVTLFNSVVHMFLVFIFNNNNNKKSSTTHTCVPISKVSTIQMWHAHLIYNSYKGCMVGFIS
jgi:ATP/ADP translocase